VSGDKDTEDYRKRVADVVASLDTNDFDDLSPVEIDAFDEAAEKARNEPPDCDANQKPLPVSDFIAFSPDHTYIHRATRDVWTSVAVNARVLPIKVGGGRSRSQPAHGSTATTRWNSAPGHPANLRSSRTG
jgi:hypothetical protein